MRFCYRFNRQKKLIHNRPKMEKNWTQRCLTRNTKKCRESEIKIVSRLEKNLNRFEPSLKTFLICKRSWSFDISSDQKFIFFQPFRFFNVCRWLLFVEILVIKLLRSKQSNIYSSSKYRIFMEKQIFASYFKDPGEISSAPTCM